MISVTDALNVAGQALQAGDRARAEHVYRQILAAVPDEPRSLFCLAMLTLDAGRFSEAEEFLHQAIAIAPGEAMLHNSLHIALLRQGRAEEALESCRRAVKLAPESAELQNNLALVQKQLGSLEEARQSLQRAVELRPGYADAHYNLGNLWVQLRDLGEAERAFRRAIELEPRDWQPHNNLGNILQLQARYDEAAACFEAALTAQPQAAEAQRNRALLQLLLGDYAGGWSRYEWRFRMPSYRAPYRTAPAWRGEPLAGHAILLWAEQGLGDTIQFIRYARRVRQRGARVIVECPAVLHALFAGTPGIDQLVASADQQPYDYHLPLLSVPAMLQTTLETIPWPGPYVFADPAREARWRQELSTLEGVKVGIAWQGSPSFAGDYYRSPPLEALAPVLGTSGVALVSLQKGHGREQLTAVADRWPIVDLADRIDAEGNAFVDTAAVMRQLDLVITSDTAIAHLAGALGVPVWLALQLAPNWRWLVGRDDSPWYPSMRLFRQRQFGDWSSVFGEMATALQALVG